VIVEMQKVTLLVTSSSRERALQKLAQLGVLHVDTGSISASDDIRILESARAELDASLRLLAAESESAVEIEPWLTPDYVDYILHMARQRDQLESQLGDLQPQLTWYENWGDVSPESLARLADAGIAVHFCLVDAKQLDDLPADRVARIVREEGSTAYVALIGPVMEERLGLRQDPIPDEGQEALAARAGELQAQIAGIDTELQQLAGIRGKLEAFGLELDKKLEFSQVRDSMGVEGRISYVRGYCPNEGVAAVEAAAREEGWACLAQEPDDPDQVPVLVRTPRWLRMINPVFSLLGTVPGYTEYDISFWFLLFFSLFFALLIGDAGYGAIFLAASLYLSRKLSSAPREPFRLVFVLSGATIIWGGLTGTWFGYEGFAQLPGLDRLVIERINSFAKDPDKVQSFIMSLCFIIGAVHLTVAHAIVAARHLPSPRALGQVGWITIVWCLYLVAGSLVLGRDLPAFMPTMTDVFAGVAVGCGLVLVFADFQPKSIIKGILASLGDLPQLILNVIGSFGDVVSYLRLFAVGVATVVVASSFNDMAASIGMGPPLYGLPAAIVLLLGHGLNIILAMMAVLVHGVRLNMLEFSGHLDMQWSGKPYRPFTT